MTFPREALNRLRWGAGGLDGVVVTYIHRGAPGGLASVMGEDITELGRSFFVVGEAHIPYHRIVLIERGREIVFRAPPNGGAHCSSGNCA
ncbi:MAG: RNA repair domain-containing protein [Euryarchaeota archaeon]|nr:RNA repair domain-containing protein [Euryarchaeota archaeon]